MTLLAPLVPIVPLILTHLAPGLPSLAGRLIDDGAPWWVMNPAAGVVPALVLILLVPWGAALPVAGVRPPVRPRPRPWRVPRGMVRAAGAAPRCR